jgi:uncharacterized Zn finger protein (UPF0148 family)
VDAEKYSRSIAMQCPTCGNTDFKYDSEDNSGPIECNSCNRVMTREELMTENGAHIEAHLEELKKDVVKDVRDDLSATLRKAFSGSKYIKIK